jgi:predicted ATPase
VDQQRILTPDQRLRVFVSSTLRELALERTAAREAISSLHLAPVLFELGARPHAPRDLYSAYVDQCDVFVGVYWQSYGWIVPGGMISGLEDEFDLAQGKPMLLYIKEPAPEREERLGALIRRIEEEAGPAYRTFASPTELGDLVTNDLALLLAERFQRTAEEPEQQSRLPAQTTSFVGRDDELAELLELIERSDVRLVTLTGPGGIGKTRLAIEAARRLIPNFADGAAYVPLDRLADAELVPAAIAEAVGFSALGSDQESGLMRWLGERRMLLVLDNFEHVVAAAPFVTRLLEAAGDIEVLATSREPLRLQGEHQYAVPPLADASALFMERVDAVRPGVAWDEASVRAGTEICRRLDGLPLAVELVAAGARMLPPRALLEYLGSSLHAPSIGRRDAPARQQTIRATIDWSYEILDEPERDLFERLGAFGGSFTIEAAQSVAGGERLAVLGSLSALVEKSLVAHSASESETRFRMLQLVSDYAAERLADRVDADDIRSMHVAYYAELASAAYAGLRGSEQRGWNEVLNAEVENLRRALDQLSATGRFDEAAEIVWSVWPYWLAGHYLEGRKIIGDLLVAPVELSEQTRARLRSLEGILAALRSDPPAAHAELEEALEWLETHHDDEARALALTGLGIATAPIDADQARTFMLESARLFASVEDAWGEAIVLCSLGWLDVGRGDFTNENLMERAYSLARYLDDEVATAHSASNLAELYLASGRPDKARRALNVALTAYEAIHLYDGLSYALETVARIAMADHPADAARLLGAADALRDEAAIPIWGPRLTRFQTLVSSVRATLSDAIFDTKWEEGRTLRFDAALEHARITLRPAELTDTA